MNALTSVLPKPPLLGLSKLIGNTPLVRVTHKFKEKANSIYAKYEVNNLIGRIKYRMVYCIIQESYKDGIFVAPDQSKVYVSNIVDTELYSINLSNSTQIGSRLSVTNAKPHNLLVNIEGDKLFVTHYGPTANP